MTIDWWTLGLQTVNVLVLLWLLSRFLFKPVAGIIAARKAAIDKQLADAEAAKAAALAEKQKLEQADSEIAAAREAALKQAADAGEAEKKRILAAARADADAARAAAEADIARAKASETAETTARAGRLALDIAGKLLDRLPPGARVEGFAEGLATAVAALPDEERQAIGKDGTALVVKAPRALTAAEQQDLSDRLAAVVGRQVPLDIAVDPGVIAGLEIETPYAEVRNSLRADLDRVGAALAPAAANGGGK